jgi:hypothetical protein
MKFCPNCGTKVPRPSKKNLAKAKAAFEILEKRKEQSLDATQQGLTKTFQYLALVTTNLTGFGSLLTSLMDVNDEIKRNPILLKNREFFINTKMLLSFMLLKSTSLSFDNPNQQIASGVKDIFNHPAGCFSVAARLDKIGSTTEDFVKTYEKYLSTLNHADLVKAAVALKDVSENLDLGLVEVQNVGDQASKQKEAARKTF